MAKRFTATEKWADRWFRSLTPEQKLGWQYLCDNCDAAGVIDLDQELANFQIGREVAWEALIVLAGDRIEKLSRGKLWLTGFITFQFGTLSEECKPHRPIIALVEKYGLSERVLKGYQNPPDRAQDKTRTRQDKEQEKDKGGAGGKRRKAIDPSEVPVPDGFETPEVRAAIGRWLDYKSANGQTYTDPSYFARKVSEYARAGPAAFIAAVDSSIGNTYKGLFPAKDFNGNSQQTTRPNHRYVEETNA